MRLGLGVNIVAWHFGHSWQQAIMCVIRRIGVALAGADVSGGCRGHWEVCAWSMKLTFKIKARRKFPGCTEFTETIYEMLKNPRKLDDLPRALAAGCPPLRRMSGRTRYRHTFSSHRVHHGKCEQR